MPLMPLSTQAQRAAPTRRTACTAVAQDAAPVAAPPKTVYGSIRGTATHAIPQPCPQEPQAWSAGKGWPTITFLFDGSWLRCELPSGRVLYYFGARVSQGEFGPVLKYVVPRYVTKSGPAVAYPTWGGKLTENIVQATAADLLRRALVTLDGYGFELIAHVHDEIVGECIEQAAPEFEKRLAEVMVDAPAWASKLPLAVETWSGVAYG